MTVFFHFVLFCSEKISKLLEYLITLTFAAIPFPYLHGVIHRDHFVIPLDRVSLLLVHFLSCLVNPA